MPDNEILSGSHPQYIQKKKNDSPSSFPSVSVSIAILFLLKVIRLYYPTPQSLALHPGAGIPFDLLVRRNNHLIVYQAKRRSYISKEVLLRLSFKVTRLQEVLHQPVFQRMVGDDNQTSAGFQHLKRLLQHLTQSTHFIIHLDTQGLKYLSQNFFSLSFPVKGFITSKSRRSFLSSSLPGCAPRRKPACVPLSILRKGRTGRPTVLPYMY